MPKSRFFFVNVVAVAEFERLFPHRFGTVQQILYFVFVPGGTAGVFKQFADDPVVLAHQYQFAFRGQV